MSTFVILSTCKQLPHQQCADTFVVSLETPEGKWSAFLFVIWSCHVRSHSILKQPLAWLIAICRSGWDVQQSNLRQPADTAVRRVCNQQSWPVFYSDGRWILFFFDWTLDDCKSRSMHSSCTDDYRRILLVDHLKLELLETRYTGYVSGLWTNQKVFINKNSSLLNASRPKTVPSDQCSADKVCIFEWGGSSILDGWAAPFGAQSFWTSWHTLHTNLKLACHVWYPDIPTTQTTEIGTRSHVSVSLVFLAQRFPALSPWLL